MVNNRRSEMAMRAALFSSNATSSEIKSTLQETGNRQRTSAEAPQELMGHADAGQTYSMDASHTKYSSGTEDHSGYATPSTGHNLAMRLHAIDEASEETEYDADSSGRQGKVRRNLMSGFRRVAKAVRTATVLKGEGGRRHNVGGRAQQGGYVRGTVLAERITHTHMASSTQEEERQYVLYPGTGHIPRPIGARSTMSMAASEQRMALQPGPRQRSLTQQSPTVPAMSRTQSQQQRVRSHHGGLAHVHTSGSLASMGQMSSSGSSVRSSAAGSMHETPAMEGSGRRDSSALESRSPAVRRLSAARFSGRRSTTERVCASWEVVGDTVSSKPHSTRSAEAMPILTQGRRQVLTLPRRERSMTVPCSEQQAGGRIELRIPHSPLLKPATQASVGHSAGTRIQRQAARNLSGKALAKVVDDLLVAQQLPSPADTTAGNALASVDSSLDALERTPLSRMLVDSAAADARVSGGSLSEALDADAVGFKMQSDGLRHYLKLSPNTSDYGSTVQADGAPDCVKFTRAYDEAPRAASHARLPELRTVYNSGVQVHRNAATSVSASESDLMHALPRISASLHRPSAYSSQQSLPLGGEARATSPPNSFSFGHSRYSLVNADGSLNLINFQFEHLDGYQKRLSATGSGAVSSPHSGEVGLGGRLMRKNAEGGRLWGSAEVADGSVVDVNGRQRRLTRKPRKQTPLSPPRARTETVLPAGLLQLQPLSVNLWTPTGEARRRPRASASLAGGHTRSPSASTTHSAIHSISAAARASEGSVGAWSSTSRRASQQMSVYPLSDARPGSVTTRWPRLMQMAPESVPFDAIYQRSAAAMTLEQALTLVECSSLQSVPSTGSPSGSKHHHRRLHKRSASALTGFELDDIMIRTAETCHSVQTAIRVQQADESGLRNWIESVLDRQQQPMSDLAPRLSQSSSFESPTDVRPLVPDVSVTAACPLSPREPASPADDRPEFFSADCSPDGAQYCEEDRFSTQQHVPEFRSSCSEAAGQSRTSLSQWSIQSSHRPVRILSGAVPSAMSAVGSLRTDQQSDSQESLAMHDPVAVVSATSPHSHG
ncbi:hypothetical protein COEREDRAFT_97914 [Coemansia reversa NRRL 1564]|uniref:Uncharacterized protein n=1 Tax=Coemansia reversa (strain ATCC 12441 / NRRL 1564) TaxID=763665 RepID=A0A2G5B9X7_COERN|nr:hypothetical protein COEREDRAFT_97914 [Coemansia reversa NRRL 1564]|eukprot:PIA15782.1 hypothetical protein COEREDRAFT_97914 [Coemansia reversa NRRL 1564]